MVLEACVENINEALLAESLGANRIELCDYLRVGGTTPSAGTIAIARKLLQIPIMVLIRPRGGSFIYSSNEIEIMKQDIRICKDIGVNGVVLGVLTKEKTVDIELLHKLTTLARPLEITFHKAIDETEDILHEFKKLMECDIDRTLTSGGEKTAFLGKHIINEMVKISNGKIKIIAAGKIIKTDLPKIMKIIHTKDFHGKKIVGNLTKRFK